MGVFRGLGGCLCVLVVLDGFRRVCGLLGGCCGGVFVPFDLGGSVSEKLTDFSAAGDRLGELKAQRMILAEAMESEKAHPRDLPGLSRRLSEVAMEIERFEGELAEGAPESKTSTEGDVKFSLRAV